MVATLSLLGLYSFRGDILDDFKLPEGIDRDDFVEMLLFDTAELELLTPDPDIMKLLLGRWSNVRINAWSKMLDTETVEYNPIHNYDRQEDWVDDGTGSVKNSGSNITDLSVAGLTKQIWPTGNAPFRLPAPEPTLPRRADTPRGSPATLALPPLNRCWRANAKAGNIRQCTRS